MMGRNRDRLAVGNGFTLGMEGLNHLIDPIILGARGVELDPDSIFRDGG
jgi:hypothetical protein